MMSKDEKQEAVSNADTPREIAAIEIFWMCIAPLFVSSALSTFWKPITYWQAFTALWALVLVLAFIRKALTPEHLSYTRWYYDRQDRIAALEARHD